MKVFEQFLNSMDSYELKEELKSLYQNVPSVKEYYELKFSGENVKKGIITKYQAKIDEAIFPNDRFEGGLDIDLIDEVLKKIKKNPKIRYYIELGNYAIRQATVMANLYGGDYGEDFYIYFEELYEEIISKAIEKGYGEEYKLEFKDLANTAFDGYGHYDQLNDVFKEKYNWKEI